MEFKLNHPFFIYPRGIMSEYNNYELYKFEVIRLYNFIKNLNIDIIKKYNDKEILIPFIIGSPMEDALVKSNTSFDNFFQYKQLFPNYINNFIKKNNKKKFIQLIIISPDNIFSNQTFTPYFTLYESFDFIKINDLEYFYSDEINEIKINIFNCPIPSIELRKNLFLRYEQILNTNNYSITSYKQTLDDLEFIDKFYIQINKLFSLNNISNIQIIINSWVSFKNLDGYSENYNMFPKILSFANKYNIIATEWEFIDELFLTKIISDYNFQNNNFQNYYINYIFDDFTDLPENIIKINFNYKNIFKLDFYNK
jgi:hypothetical protein